MRQGGKITGKSLLTDKTYEIATVRKGTNGSPRQIVKPATDKLPCLTASYYKGINADGRPGKAKSFGDYRKRQDRNALTCGVRKNANCSRRDIPKV